MERQKPQQNKDDKDDLADVLSNMDRRMAEDERAVNEPLVTRTNSLSRCRNILLVLAETEIDRVSVSISNIMTMEIPEFQGVIEALQKAIPFIEEADEEIRRLVDAAPDTNEAKT